MNIIIFFINDYGILKEKINFHELKTYLLCAEGQLTDNLNTIIQENSVEIIRLVDPFNIPEIIKSIKERLEKLSSIDTIYLAGSSQEKELYKISVALRDAGYETVTTNNLKKELDKKKAKEEIEKAKREKKATRNNEGAETKSKKNTIDKRQNKKKGLFKNFGKALAQTTDKEKREHVAQNQKTETNKNGYEDKTQEEVNCTSFKNGSNKTELEEQEEKDISIINKEVFTEVSDAKRRITIAITKRIQFHLKILTRSEFDYLEVLTLMELIAKLPNKDQWEKREHIPWSLKAEREKLLDSWNANQGKKELNDSIPGGNEKTKLKAMTEENYEKLKAEMIYYYNLTAFLFDEDKWTDWI